LARSADHRDLHNQAPTFNFEARVFSDLLALAPGMNTLGSDVASAVEDEAELPGRPRQGSVDPAARALIERARLAPWQIATWTDGGRAQSIVFDGQGRYRYERTTVHGLKEQVVCDGARLWHLYPELGVGARRTVGRHARQSLAAMVPWHVLPVEDYALGADVKSLGPQTIAIVPHGREPVEATTGQKGTEQVAAPPHLEEHLTFATESKPAGRLVERKFVLMPEGKLLAKVTYAADGTVRVQNGEAKKLGETRLAVAETVALDMKVDPRLVILPLPARTHEHVLTNAGGAKRNERGGKAEARYGARLPAEVNTDDWDDEDVLRLIASNLTRDREGDLAEWMITSWFFARGDRRLGFYTLLLSLPKSKWRFDGSELVDGRHVAMNPLADHPDSPLAHYIARQSWFNAPGNDKSSDTAPRSIKPRDDLARGQFIGALAELRDAHYEHQRLREKASGETAAKRAEAKDDPTLYIDALLDRAQRCRSPYLVWAYLEHVPQWIGELPADQRAGAYRALAKRYHELGHSPLGYAARYEQAVCYRESARHESRTAERGKDQVEARRLFAQVFRDVVAAGEAPALDARFFETLPLFQADELIREGAASLIKGGRYAQAVALAWQCRHLSLEGAADEMVELTLRAPPAGDRALVSAAAIEYYLHAKNFAQANAVMESLLADERLAELPSLWRLAAVLADKQGQQLRAADCLEQALRRLEDESGMRNSEFGIRNGPNPQSEIRIPQLAEAYTDLLDRYGRLASAVAGLDAAAQADLAARVARIAERRRALEEDPTEVCRQAAEVLRRLGQSEAAWDYLTTPLALRPGEAEPWVNLADALKAEMDYDLADRAYAAAFDVEGSNPTHLWSRAQLAQERGGFAEAKALYRRIADGAWPPQHATLQKQAKEILGR
jgi:hypothetical protein